MLINYQIIACDFLLHIIFDYVCIFWKRGRKIPVFRIWHYNSLGAILYTAPYQLAFFVGFVR